MQISSPPLLNTTASKQRGMTFWGTLIVLAAVLLVGMVGLKTLPAYLEFNSIRSAIKKIGKEDLSQKTQREVAAEFDRQATIDNMDSVKGADLALNNGVVSVAYQKEIPLFANISLLLDFKTASS